MEQTPPGPPPPPPPSDETTFWLVLCMRTNRSSSSSSVQALASLRRILGMPTAEDVEEAAAHEVPNAVFAVIASSGISRMTGCDLRRRGSRSDEAWRRRGLTLGSCSERLQRRHRCLD